MWNRINFEAWFKGNNMPPEQLKDLNEQLYHQTAGLTLQVASKQVGNENATCFFYGCLRVLE